ncbi:Lem3 protein [Saccharomycopsis crataegensis]|uniref:Lem3 protein n=1 Tax=Saccharomycopsis crataegensis TaxID=43959 RepID=A0AAV5QRD6_9ASCO|nr:Lem3 protein [Saccharomycopsis crataegensis]
MGLIKRKNNDSDDVDSISDYEKEPEEKVKSRRPGDNAFRQQRLKAYNPIITTKTVIPLFLLFAVVFVPLGAAMLYGSNQVQDLVIDYEQCENMANADYFTEIPEEYFEYNFKTPITEKPQWKLVTNASESDPVENKICQVQFPVPNDIDGPVYFFYQLENFYANHRRYVISYCELQLNGEPSSVHVVKDTIGQNCQPMSTDPASGLIYYPCGLIANAMFNDTFTYPAAINGTSDDYVMTQKGIAWSTDKNRLKKTQYNASQIVPPPNWVKKFPDGYNDDNIPDISTWEEFQNWMHPAGLSKFSILYFRNDDDQLKAGSYQVNIGLHWPVLPFNGKKAFYISTRSVLGGKNSFLGIAWIVGGGLCFVLGLVFLVIHLISPRKMGDTSLLSWNKEKQHAE